MVVERIWRGARWKTSAESVNQFFMSEMSEDVYLMGSVAGLVVLVTTEGESGRTRPMLVEMGAAEDSGVSSGKTRLSARYIAFAVLILA